MTHHADERFLAAAIRVGLRQRGRTSPNPSVGCLVVKDGLVAGVGATGLGGRPHGETEALKDARSKTRGATAYVSLEPCNHHGKTGPCTEALIAAGVARVVIALADPDERVSGGGAKRLREGGVDVAFEPSERLRRAALAAHRGHIMRMIKGRPFITLKLALSADGAIGREGEGPIAITGALANRLTHALRARSDAIAVGARTLVQDTPRLTVRLPGLENHGPRRFVFGGAKPPGGFHHLPGHDLALNVQQLGKHGVTELLVEGGAQIGRSLLDAGLVDELYLLRGTPVLGAGSIKPFAGDPFADLGACGLAGWQPVERRQLGEDHLLRLQPVGYRTA